MGGNRRLSVRSFVLVLVAVMLAALLAAPGCVRQEKGAGRKAPEAGEPSGREPEAGKAPEGAELEARLTPPGGSYADIVEKVQDPVVNIFTTKQVKSSDELGPMFNDPFFRRFFGPFHPEIPREQRSLGSGVVIAADGDILTNNHVVDGADEIKVFLRDKRQFDAKVLGTDPQTDVALLKIDATGLATLPFGDSDAVRIGDVVLAIGNPFGLDHTVTMGIISAKGRSGILPSQDKNLYEDFLQTDAAINPGNSGGALIDTQGRLVGINTAIASQTGGYQGVGFAIPINMAKKVVESLRTEGKVTRGWLGIVIQNVSQDMAEAMGLKVLKGALVADVVAGGPADKAGVRRGDVIVGFQGKPIEDVGELRNTVSLTKPGTQAEVKLLRDGQELTLTVEIAEMEKGMQKAGMRGAPGRGEDTGLGIRVKDMNDQDTEQCGIDPSLKGVLVVGVQPGSKAEKAGLQQCDVILEVNRQPVDSVAKFQDLAKKRGKGVLLLLVNSNGATHFVAIK